MLSVTSVAAVEYGGVGGRPAQPREDNPRTKSIFIHVIEPGEQKNEGITVMNTSGSTKTVLIYATDAERATDGAFACKQFADTKSGVGAWVALEREEITLAPGAEQIVPFTIIAPTTASTGEHNGCIVIQEKKEKQENGAAGVTLSFRTGLRVALTVPGELVRSLEVVGFQTAKQKDGHFVLRPEVRNTGNVSLDTDVRITVRSFLGPIVAEKGGVYPVLRGEDAAWNFEVDRPFWGGWYRSSFIASYDVGEGAGIGMEGGAGDRATLHGPSAWFFSVPKWQASLIYVVILVVIAIIVRVVMRARQVKRWIAKSWKPYEVQPGDTVTSLATARGIPWKMIARANRLKPPYLLDAGASIQLPMPLERLSHHASGENRG